MKPSAIHKLTVIAFTCMLMLGVAACSKPEEPQKPAAVASTEEPQTPAAVATTEEPDVVSEASPYDGPPTDTSKELPVRVIPNIPPAAEAYYASDSLHVIAQTQDPDAQQPEGGRVGGALTYIFTDEGEEIRRINDRGQDACSYYFPDMKRIVWTSTKDNMDMPLGDWSSQDLYPQGAELYTSDLEGKNIQRLTDNEFYEAEVSISPNGEWIVFGRQIEGKLDIWRMRADGTDEQQITFTDDWQEGAPFYLPDNETILFRAWKKDEYGKIYPTPMTVFTIKHDGTERTVRTFDRDMNWAPYPAPDGRHYVFVRVVPGNNWEVFLGDLAGGEPVRLTYHDGFDGLPSLSPDGTKMLFARAGSDGESLTTYVMDMTSFDIGPEHYKGVPSIEPPPNEG